MKHTVLLNLCLIGVISGCTTEKAADTEAVQRVGSDRDEHGCIGSAGYKWCERTKNCERPWELAEAHGFDNSPEAFLTYCGE